MIDDKLKNDLFQGEKQKEEKDILIDTDDDGIPDDWEINGYTVENGKIVKWEDDKHLNKKFIKYVSDPYNSRTTGDPFTDYDKVMKKCDYAILEEARHPLVAAYPKIGVNMEKLILSKNQTSTKETGGSKGTNTAKTISVSTTNSHMESTSAGGSISAGWPSGVSVSANFSKEWSNSVAVDKGNSDTTGISENETWSDALSMNESEAALLNGNIRYLNVGTAPIYNLRPTLNFVLGENKNGQTLNTIIAKVNTAANVILPHETYPTSGQNPISWNTRDDFNAQPIKINLEQLKKLEKGEKLQIQTTQSSGLFKIYRYDGSTLINEYQRWEHEMGDIYNKTACITIVFQNGIVAERRVYAPRVDDPHPLNHLQLTLKEAIVLAFKDAKIEDGKIIYKQMKYGFVNIVMDKITHKLMNKQMIASNNSNIFDVNIKQGMNILFQEDKDMYIKNECSWILDAIKKILKLKNYKSIFKVTNNDTKVFEDLRNQLLETDLNQDMIKSIKFRLDKSDDWYWLSMTYKNYEIGVLEIR